MLKKRNRAGRRDIEEIFKRGRTINSAHISFKFVNSEEKGPRISFIVPKSVYKGAVKRNTLRRQGYNAIEEFTEGLPESIHGAFIFRRDPRGIEAVRNEIKKIIDKIN